ncbi:MULTISPECIES: DUF397 domain-containing protein [Actinomadura]|uniref:DUF397 domain-containing protein n=1 Tax=Actinomadura TaxID=1988 RepID=UPI000A04A006|nr:MULTISPECIES: DUF397 domain-containing protein [Actinomadura]RSN44333.1 DUF397 domain-containing protein [Actinomadura sp. WAC 06369]
MDLSTAVWRKASRSTSNGGNCVEVADLSSAVAVRDSKDPDGPKLTVSRDDFRRFAKAIKGL